MNEGRRGEGEGRGGEEKGRGGEKEKGNQSRVPQMRYMEIESWAIPTGFLTFFSLI